MSDAPDPAPQHFEVAETIGEIHVFPRPVVWTAGLVIAAVAAFGLYQGVKGGISGQAAGNGQGELATGDAVSAQAAAPLPANTQWSTINGPAMGAPSAPKAASSTPDDSDAADDSDEPDSTAAAATSAAPAPASAQPPSSVAASAQPPAATAP
jgi:hypothetical protein